MLRDGTDVSAMRERLVFGAANLGDGGHSGQNSVAAMSDEAEICGCNGVCKGTIVKAITDKKLFTLDDVRAHTKASASCGSCTGLVEQVLAFTLGGDYSSAPKVKPMCDCTDHSHDDVAPRHRRAEAEDHSRRACRLHGLEDRQRLPLLPPGAELLSALRPGPANIATTSSRASSTNASTPTSRRTAPIRWCRACGAA